MQYQKKANPCPRLAYINYSINQKSPAFLQGPNGPVPVKSLETFNLDNSALVEYGNSIQKVEREYVSTQIRIVTK